MLNELNISSFKTCFDVSEKSSEFSNFPIMFFTSVMWNYHSVKECFRYLLKHIL